MPASTLARSCKNSFAMSAKMRFRSGTVRIGVHAASRLWLFSLARGSGELAKHKTVADIPSNAWKCRRHRLLV